MKLERPLLEHRICGQPRYNALIPRERDGEGPCDFGVLTGAF